MRSSTLLVLFAPLAVAACGLTAAGSATVAGSADAAVAPLDAGDDSVAIHDGAFDAIGEAEAPDAADASLDAADAAASYCAGQTAFFCADFDEGALATGWSGLQVDVGATSVLDTTASASPPASYVATSPPLGGGSQEHAYLFRALTDVPKHVRFAFDLRVDHFPAGQSILVAAIVIPAPAGKYSLQLNVTSTGARVTEQFPDTSVADQPLGRSPALGVWSRVDIDAKLDDPTNIDVKIDGVAALHGALSPTIAPGPLSFDLGIVFVHGPTDGASVHFDNVIFDKLP